MKKRSLKPLWILLSVIAGLSLLVVFLSSIGVGLRSYQYDASGYETGGGTVAGVIRSVEIDWLAGDVILTVSEDDRYASVSETAEGGLGTAEQVRWLLDGDGVLHIRSRAPANVLLGATPSKELVVRLPEEMAGALEKVTVSAAQGEVILEGLTAESVALPDVSGSAYLTDCRMTSVFLKVGGAVRADLTAVPEDAHFSLGGEMKLYLPEDAAFSLTCEGISGGVVTDFPLTGGDGSYICGTGGGTIAVIGTKGNTELVIYRKSPAE